jgi:hypothetical protein
MEKQILFAIKSLERRVVDLYSKLKNGTSSSKYKVYTALLTQSGGDSPLNTSTGLLTIGVTYLINDAVIDMDFTNVGAPNNNVGTYFVATGTNPNWGTNPLGSAILNYNEGAPVVTVLENTIGNIWFEYYGVGNYLVKSDNLFLDKKTTFSLSPNGYIESPTDIHSIDISWTPAEENILGIATYYNNTLQDDQLNYGGNAFIEIRVYN